MKQQVRKVLIVDDCQEDQELYRRYLIKDERYRYQILKAESGEKGLELCLSAQPDVILLDYFLPDWDGLELLYELKTTPQLTSLPIIMLTGYGNEAVAVAALKGGALDYLVKETLTPEYLCHSIHTSIENASLKQKLRQSQEQELLMALSALRIRRFLNLEDILNSTVMEVRHFLKCDRVVVYQFAADKSGSIIAESVAEGCTTSLNTQIIDTCFQTEAGEEYKKGKKRAIANIYEAGLSDCHIQLLEKFQIKSNLVVPILLRAEEEIEQEKTINKNTSLPADISPEASDHLWGLLIAHQCSNFRQWKIEELQFLSKLTVQIAIAIGQEQFQQIQAAKREAEAANMAKTQFLANMTHELRTPLNAILGFTQVLNRSLNLTTEQQQQLQIINSSGEHLLKVINDILQISKIEAGVTELSLACSNLFVLLESLREMLQIQAQSKGLQLIFELSPDLPEYVETDHNKLRQVLLNLLSNAIKFTTKGCVILRAKVTDPPENLKKIFKEKAKPRGLAFEIEDTGYGIAKQELDKLFDAFFQSKSGRKTTEGTGLGLSISQRFVELMGGKITINSQLGQGTVAAFDIAVTLPTKTEIAQPSKLEKRVLRLAPNQPQYRLLVAEDKWESRQLLVIMLSRLGFEVLEAANGQEVIALWEKTQPDLILMDMQMPVLDGYEATKHIRATSDQTTVIIALTASAFDERKAALMAIGCNEVIHKPFREEVLLEKIADYLGVRYIYDQSSEIPAPKLLVNSSKLTKEDLSFMPSEWLEKLYNAADAVDDEKILALLKQIPEQYMKVKLHLIDLVDNFRLDIISDLREENR